MEKTKKERRLPSIPVAYALFALVLFLLGICGAVLGANMKIMFVVCIAVLTLAAMYYGMTWKDVIEAISNRIGRMASFFLIVMGIGYVIASYMMAGTGPMLVRWFSALISPKYIVVLTFALTSVLSCLLGTSFGTIGTLGILMFATAQMMGVDLALAAGSTICGCMFGTLISPFNDGMVGGPVPFNRTYYDVVKLYIIPVVVSFVIGCVYFVIAGAKYGSSVSGANMDYINEINAQIASIYNCNIIVLLPLVMAIVLVFLRVDIVVNFFVSGTVGCLLGILVQGFSVKDCIEALYSGFNTATFFPGVELSDGLTGLLNRGGLGNQGEGILFTMLVVSMSTIMEEIGVFEVIKQTAFKKTDNIGVLNFVTGAVTGLLSLVTVDGVPTAIISRSMFNGAWEDAGYDVSGIAKFPQAWCAWMGNVPPWTFPCFYFSMLTACEVSKWWPYTLFMLGVPILMMVLGFFGLGVPKKKAAAVDAE